jgi:hypothetical protein
MQIDRVLGQYRDVTIPPSILVPAATAGTGTDFEHVVFALTQLATASGAAGEMPNNRLNVRSALLTFEAAITGAATNNFTLNVWQKRSGALLVNTNSATTITAGQQTVTPASMANIVPGAQLVFSGGTGAAETVAVQSVTSTTFTAVFANGHSGGYTITSAPLATVTYASGTNEAALVPHQFNVAMLAANALAPGDVITIQRVSAGTGLASPSFTATLDLQPAGIN